MDNVKLLGRLGFCVAVVLSLSACKTETVKDGAASQNYQEASALNVQLGLQYLSNGNMPRAKQKLLLAVQQDPSATSYSGLAYFYEQTSEMQQAKTYYLKAIAAAPKAGAGHNNYGAFLCRQGQYQAGEHQFHLAIADPNYLNTAGAYENAGLCALLIPNPAQAKKYFILALQHNPNLPNSLAQLAKLKQQQSQHLTSCGGKQCRSN